MNVKIDHTGVLLTKNVSTHRAVINVYIDVRQALNLQDLGLVEVCVYFQLSKSKLSLFERFFTTNVLLSDIDTV